VVISLGAQVFEGLKGDLGVPYESGTASSQWLTESGEVSESEAAYARTLLTPRRCASFTSLSKQLLAQNSIGVENFTRDSLTRTIATAIDRGALSGSGNNEPLGILNNTGTLSVQFGGAATFAKCIAFQDSLTSANVGNTPDARLAYVASPTTASKWQQAAEVATFPTFLWTGHQWNGTVAGLPAVSTSSITDNRVICGDFSKLVIGMWGSEAIEILADPFAQKKAGVVEFICTSYMDCGVTNPANFCTSSDSGSQ
jgi:HK97 family phage major capsid protein